MLISFPREPEFQAAILILMPLSPKTSKFTARSKNPRSTNLGTKGLILVKTPFCVSSLCEKLFFLAKNYEQTISEKVLDKQKFKRSLLWAISFNYLSKSYI